MTEAEAVQVREAVRAALAVPVLPVDRRRSRNAAVRKRQREAARRPPQHEAGVAFVWPRRRR